MMLKVGSIRQSETLFHVCPRLEMVRPENLRHSSDH